MTPDRANAARNSRADVVDAALTLLDENGLPDLTMRRIAASLGVQPSALYWHFANKQSLLAAVTDRILEPVVAPAHAAPPQTDWEQDFRAIAARLRDALLAYRDGAELVSSSLALGLSEFAAGGALLEAALRSGATPAAAQTATNAVTHYTLGYVFHEQQRMQADALGAVAEASTLTPGSALATGDDHLDGVTLIARGLAASRDRAARS